MTAKHVVFCNKGYLSWDDKGPMATGAPVWTTLLDARLYNFESQAKTAAESVCQWDRMVELSIVRIQLVRVNVVPFTPKRQDPEYQEYLRLKEKFKD